MFIKNGKIYAQKLGDPGIIYPRHLDVYGSCTRGTRVYISDTHGRHFIPVLGFRNTGRGIPWVPELTIHRMPICAAQKTTTHGCAGFTHTSHT